MLSQPEADNLRIQQAVKMSDSKPLAPKLKPAPKSKSTWRDYNYPCKFKKPHGCKGETQIIDSACDACVANGKF